MVRLLATGAVSVTARTALETRYQTTNPRALRRAIQAQLTALLHPPVEAAQEPAG